MSLLDKLMLRFGFVADPRTFAGRPDRSSSNTEGLERINWGGEERIGSYVELDRGFEYTVDPTIDFRAARKEPEIPGKPDDSEFLEEWERPSPTPPRKVDIGGNGTLLVWNNEGRGGLPYRAQVITKSKIR